VSLKENNLSLKPEELLRVDDFRRERDTSVLVIMFTDLQGSTEIAEKHGEHYATKLRKRHDKLLLEIIERNKQGLYIKNIGDSIMAVFSEPSVAVERSLEIQEKIKLLNKKFSADVPIIVRIGLHMGQVSVEDKTSIDVFGRHVNRAARIESITPGAHIFLSYSVYDSAKGWLNSKEIAFKFHGEYKLKGILHPIKIYEVWNPNKAYPLAPSLKSEQQKSVLKQRLLGSIFLCSLILLLLIKLRKPNTINKPIPPSNSSIASDAIQTNQNKPDEPIAISSAGINLNIPSSASSTPKATVASTDDNKKVSPASQIPIKNTTLPTKTQKKQVSEPDSPKGPPEWIQQEKEKREAARKRAKAQREKERERKKLEKKRRKAEKRKKQKQKKKFPTIRQKTKEKIENIQDQLKKELENLKKEAEKWKLD
jgi:class 3 adenylate cyclase